MVGCKFSLICLIAVFCVIKVRCDTAGPNHCSPGIPCDDSHQCIKREQWCDLWDHCADKSDEKYCNTKGFFRTPDNKCDALRHFICENRKCIPKVLKCDGHDDCLDYSDETDCDSSETGGPDSLNRFDKPINSSENSSSTESAYPWPTEVPPHQSTTGSIQSIRPTVDFYDNRWGERENTQRPHYNSATATAAAYTFHPPEPTPDPRYPPLPAIPTASADPFRPPDSTPDPWFPALPAIPMASADPFRPPESTPDTRFPPLPATAASSAYPFHSPEPTPDSRIPPHTDGWSFGNLPGPPFRGATVNPPSQEPCDKTISRSEDDPASHYRVPWSHFTFESSHGDSIKNRYYYNANRARDWLMAQRDAHLIWGVSTPRALVALALSSDAGFNLAANDILQRRLRIDLGARLIKRERLSPSRLALYINALIATCQNPRNVFEMDFVEMLYREVQRERAGPSGRDASPFPYLTLCLADRPMTEDDRRFLLDLAQRDVTGEISKDKFILATSALACLKKTRRHDRELDRAVDDAFFKLQQQLRGDGSFGSVYSTALAAQALIAIDSQSWNHQPTLDYLSSKQRDDGSFGDFLATYYALPVLNGKSLLHLRNIQCETGPTPPIPPRPTIPPRGPINPPPSKNVRYRLATQNPYTTFFLDMDVPVETNFFDIMKRAEILDSRFHFLSVEHDGKIDVYQINGMPNDPEFGMFWILYTGGSRDGRVDNQQRYTQDIRNLIPQDSEELLFYYVHFKPGYQ